MTLCNDKLRQLHSTIEHVASEEHNWTIEYLTTEFRQMETQYEGLYRSFQEYLREFEVQKIKREDLDSKSKRDRRDRISLRSEDDREDYRRNPEVEEIL